MKRQFGIIMAAWLLTTAFLRADTSDLLVQGPFGISGSEQTYKWQVNYPAGSLTTGLDLLEAVFGNPVLTGTYNDGFGSSFPEYQFGSGSQYTDAYLSSGGYFTISFTLNGTTVLQDPSYDPSWSYYVAGGSGAYALGGTSPGAYASGAWIYSSDGQGSRTIANGSYDGWVFGAAFPDTTATIDDTNGTAAPNSTEFANTDSTDFLTVVSVPEPSAQWVLWAVLCGLAFWRRRG